MLGESNNKDETITNLRCIFAINTILNKQLNNTPFCYLHLPDYRSYDIIQDIELKKIRNINLKPFNFYEDWARKLWCKINENKTNNIYSYQPLAYKGISKNSSNFVHLLISDFNEMGQALATQVARICHYSNNIKTKITVFEANKSKLDEYNSHVYINKLTDIEFKFNDYRIDSKRGINCLNNLIDDKNQILTIAICDDAVELALSTAISLPKKVLNSQTPILVRQNSIGGLSDLVEHYSNKKEWSNFKFFGMHEDSYGLDSTQDELAKIVNENYNKANPKYATKWSYLPEKLRWSNRYQVDSYKELVMALGLTFTSVNNSHQNKICFNNETIEWLAEREHDRWVAEKLLAGWEQADLSNCSNVEERIEMKDNKLMQHIFLVPYTKLDEIAEGTKQKDRDVINSLHDIVNKIGLKIIKG